MLVGVLSDTHYPKAYFPDVVLEVFEKQDVELIIHAGDITEPILLEKLNEVAPVLAVRGNADPPGLREVEVVDIGGMKTLVIHGHQFLSLTAQNLVYKAFEEEATLVIFGHTHRPYFEAVEAMRRKVYLLNPGSPTLPRLSPPSFALMEVEKERVKVRFYNPWDV
ncbi:metallophosphoesterase [Pyrococcus yayanosii]|uniref:Phosphoesterase n=1 Tax=Pyrococcus yayanosii (strain CH1 / JCM 16557) TaxID=529709 RepID=F8AFX4_PYRYC|nr:metallophosphoesterase [Pyrococcus yayanosii]AEH23879.1 5'-cyclic-nucleotide phosphodiesterase [Pyrococcus yayanosii CH1]